jgi:hypothetical protein
MTETPGIYLGNDGLPRPALAEPPEAHQQRVQALKGLGVDVDALKLAAGLKALLLGPPRVLDATERRRLVAALAARDLDTDTIAQALELVSVKEVWWDEVQALVDEADRGRQMANSPFDNYVLRGVRRHQDAHGLRLEIALKRNADGRTMLVPVTWSQLKSEWTLLSACAHAMGCAPILKRRYRDADFQRLRSLLVESASDEVELTRDGRRFRATVAAQRSADDTLREAIVALVDASHGCWQGLGRDLWQRLTDWVSTNGGAPYGWPSNLGGLSYAIQRIDQALGQPASTGPPVEPGISHAPGPMPFGGRAWRTSSALACAWMAVVHAREGRGKDVEAGLLHRCLLRRQEGLGFDLSRYALTNLAVPWGTQATCSPTSYGNVAMTLRRLQPRDACAARLQETVSEHGAGQV